MKKRVGAIEEFEFLSLTEGKRLHITVAITGWLSTGKYGKRWPRVGKELRRRNSELGTITLEQLGY